MTIVVMGVDPGQSVGLAVMYDERVVHVAQGSWSVIRPQLERELHAAATNPNVTAVEVGIERFAPRKNPHVRMTHQPAAQQVIGAVRDIVERYGVRITEQSAADAKRLAPNSLLSRVGIKVTPLQVACRDANDANDALRHALLLMSRRFASIVARLFRPTRTRPRG